MAPRALLQGRYPGAQRDLVAVDLQQAAVQYRLQRVDVGLAEQFDVELAVDLCSGPNWSSAIAAASWPSIRAVSRASARFVELIERQHQSTGFQQFAQHGELVDLG